LVLRITVITLLSLERGNIKCGKSYMEMGVKYFQITGLLLA